MLKSIKKLLARTNQIGHSVKIGANNRIVGSSISGKVSLPTIPHVYGAYILYSSDRLVMDQLQVNTADIGKYNAANTFGVIGDGFSTAVSWALNPLLNQNYKNNNLLQARNLIFIVQLAFFIVTFLPSIFMKELFSFLLKNEELSNTYPIAIILFMAINYRPMYIGSNNFLFYYEKTQKLWRVSLVAGIINVVLNLIFIPIYGFAAAAFTTFVSFIFMGLAGFYFKEFKQLNNVKYYPILWFLTNIGLTIIAFYVVNCKLSIKIPIVLIFSISCILFILKLNRSVNDKKTTN